MAHNNITYCRASTDEDLEQILRLQKINLPNALSEKEIQEEGFLTVVHTLDILKQMNDSCAHILAKNADKVVGYALCMHPKFANKIEVLKPMFREINNIISGRLDYIIMGQVCVDKDYRKKGIFRGLYRFMQHELKTSYNTIITEVDAANIRSLNAHKAIGFETLKEYHDLNRDWVIVGLNCSQS